jgi:hypothetical protein
MYVYAKNAAMMRSGARKIERPQPRNARMKVRR